MSKPGTTEYEYTLAGPDRLPEYVWPVVVDLVQAHAPGARRVLDAGCGNGSLAAHLKARGYEVEGFDLSTSGIRLATETYPGIPFRVASAYDDLRPLYPEPFDVVVSLEVVEHLFEPRVYVRRLRQVLRPGGLLVLSTPYHGWLKNVVVAAAGKFDHHMNPLWDGGHIKFWSRATLGHLLTEAGYRVVAFRGAGRAPWLWKSMVMAAQAPSAEQLAALISAHKAGKAG